MRERVLMTAPQIRNLIFIYQYLFVTNLINKSKYCLVTELNSQTHAFTEARNYISSGKKCCKTHIMGSVKSELALQNLRLVNSNKLMREKYIKSIFNNIKVFLTIAKLLG